MVSKMIEKNLLRKVYCKIRWCMRLVFEFVKYRSYSEDLPLSTYLKESLKFDKIYMRGFTEIDRNRIAFLKHKMFLKSDKLQLSENPLIPTVVVLVKDELDRMKLFYEHYKRLGIHQFVMIDNGSTDGTLEWLMEQSDTRVYQVLEPYSAPNKIGWTEKALALTGYNRWYIVLDSDELLDYPGSETHSAEELIIHMNNLGHRRLSGFMVDMYAEQPLFSILCEMKDVEKVYCYFDSDSFELAEKFHNGVKHKIIQGGPRKRVFDVQAPWISKQAIFYFDDTLLYRSSHFMSPIKQWDEVPCCFVFRHYKYLASDRKACMERTKIEVEYDTIMDCVDKNRNINFMYEGSKKYENSSSFYALPYVNFIDWNTNCSTQK